MLHDTQRTSAPSSVERLDEHGRLNRHVQAAHDARAGERLLALVAARAAPSGRASPARRGGFPCGRTRPATRSFTLNGSRPGLRGRVERVHLLELLCSLRPLSVSYPDSCQLLISRVELRAHLRCVAVATNNAGPFAVGSGASATILIVSNPASVEQPPHADRRRTRATRGPSAAGTPRDRAAACRRCSSRPPGFSTRAASAQRARRVRHVMQHQQQRRGVEPPSSIGSASSSPRRRSTLAKSRSRRRAACSIVAGAIDGDHRATNGASAAVTWPVPQPRSPTTHDSSSSPGSACRCDALAEQSPRAGDPTGPPPTRRTPATSSAAGRARP